MAIAVRCPTCGKPDPSGRKVRRALLLRFVALGIFVGGCWYLWEVAIPELSQDFVQKSR
jgi:hypothetical protein